MNGMEETSFNIYVSLADNIVSVIEEWKNQVAKQFEIEWISGENDMKWSIMEQFGNIPEEEMVLWKNAHTFIPKIEVRMSGLHRMNNPLGSEWWVSFSYHNETWGVWQKLVNGVMNKDITWIPRLKVPIGMTSSEVSDKMYPLLVKSHILPWQGMSWSIDSIVIPCEMEEGIVYNTYCLTGSMDGINDETVQRSINNYLFQYGIVSVSKNTFTKRETVPRQRLPFRRPQYIPVKPVRGNLRSNWNCDPVEFPSLPEGEGGRIQPRSRPVSSVSIN